MIIAKGRFEGRGGHELQGNFVLEELDGQIWMVTDDSFFFDGSPEPGFAVSASLTPTEAEAVHSRFLDLPGSGSLVGRQIEVSGRQRGRLIAPFNPLTARSVFLWCFQTPFLLGIGPLEPVGDQA